MRSANTDKAVKHLEAAIKLLRGDKSDAKNPEWFRDTGHLSDNGIEHLHSLFHNGTSIYAAAKAMGMSYRATAMRHDIWKKKQAKKA